MPRTIFILGRQPTLGIAELESYFPEVKYLNATTAVLDQAIDPSIIDSLGGTIKIASEIAVLNQPQIEGVQKFLERFDIDSFNTDRKLNFGISSYGLDVEPKELSNIGFSFKKRARELNISIRVIPNKAPDLSSAQIIHNKLVEESGFELNVIRNHENLILARTVAVQDIYKYTERDQARPYRDMKVGMLPPKLAQIMINLSRPKKGSTVLDPFCGTGVILQEALLMNHKVIGTDKDMRMVDYSTKNLEWLTQKYSGLPDWNVEFGDATTKKWDTDNFSVVSETYLGKPFINIPSHEAIKNEIKQIDKLLIDFMTNLKSQLRKDDILCIAVPAWNRNRGFIKLPLLDHLGKIGYNFVSFKTVDPTDLFYFRPHQIVARQLLVLKRN